MSDNSTSPDRLTAPTLITLLNAVVVLAIVTLLAEMLPPLTLAPVGLGAVIGPWFGAFIIARAGSRLGPRRIVLAIAVSDLLILGLSVTVAHLPAAVELLSLGRSPAWTWFTATIVISGLTGMLLTRIVGQAAEIEDGDEKEGNR